jgi:hypothetical protein
VNRLAGYRRTLAVRPSGQRIGQPLFERRSALLDGRFERVVASDQRSAFVQFQFALVPNVLEFFIGQMFDADERIVGRALRMSSSSFT